MNNPMAPTPTFEPDTQVEPDPRTDPDPDPTPEPDPTRNRSSRPEKPQMPTDAIALLKADHRAVNQLFKKFGSTSERALSMAMLSPFSL